MQKGLIVHTLIANEQGEILILQRSKKNDVLPEFWDIPGGTLEDGEDPAQGAIRETKEETGLTLSNVQLFFQKSNVDTQKNKQFVTLVFYAYTSGAEIVINLEEHDAYTWINPLKIKDYKTVDYLPDCLRSFSELKIR